MTFQITCDTLDVKVGGRVYNDNPAEDTIGKTVFRDGYADVLVRLDRTRHGMLTGTEWLVRFVSALDMSLAQKAVLECNNSIVVIMQADEEVDRAHVSWAADSIIGMHIAVVAYVKNRRTGAERPILVGCTTQKLAKSNMN